MMTVSYVSIGVGIRISSIRDGIHTWDRIGFQKRLLSIGVGVDVSVTACGGQQCGECCWSKGMTSQLRHCHCQYRDYQQEQYRSRICVRT